MDKQIIGWSLSIHREDDTKENITDIPDWCASVVDVFLTKLEEGEDENTILVADIFELKMRFAENNIDMKFEDYETSLKEMYDFYASISDKKRHEILSFHGFGVSNG